MFVVESSRLAVAMDGEPQGKGRRKEVRRESDRTCPQVFRLGMDELRGRSQSDERQMPPPADERYFELEGPSSTATQISGSLR